MKYAKKDCYGTEDVGGDAEVRRFYRAGDPIPDTIEMENKSDAEERETAPGTLNATPEPVASTTEAKTSTRSKS